MTQDLGKPVRMLNDASIQGLGVITGRGLECVLTMGTGMGFALFQDGQIAPHLELSQHPIRKRKTYDEYVGEVAFETVGRWRWTKRVRNIIGILETVITYDTLYIGGGNAELIEPPLPANVNRFQHCRDHRRCAALERTNGSRICRAATRHKMITLADRVLIDDKLDHQRAAVAGALWFKAEQISAPRPAQTGGQSKMDGPPSMSELARRIALIFHLAAQEKKADGAFTSSFSKSSKFGIVLWATEFAEFYWPYVLITYLGLKIARVDYLEKFQESRRD